MTDKTPQQEFDLFSSDDYTDEIAATPAYDNVNDNENDNEKVNVDVNVPVKAAVAPKEETNNKGNGEVKVSVNVSVDKEVSVKEKSADQQPSTSIYRRLFATFFKVGAFTLGGGYAMIPIIETEVVDKNKWIDKEEFLDLISIAQSCPGVFAINISTFIGYKLRQNKGAVCASVATALPSFLIILCIAMFFQRFTDVPWVASMFRGIRPAVVALIAVPTFNLAKSAHITLENCWIPIASALLIWALHVNPIFILIAAAIGGYVYGSYLSE